jgi:hypothetical protein
MLTYLSQPAYTLAALAAFTGLRRSESAGLTRESYDGSELQVSRSIWEGHVNEPSPPGSQRQDHSDHIAALERYHHEEYLCQNGERGFCRRNEAARDRFVR